MASVEEAIALWRTRRVLVSKDCEANLEVWIVELQAALAELGLSYADLVAYLDDNPRTWMENEYVSFLKAPSSPSGPSEAAGPRGVE
jgi:hypothetical protein